MRLDPRKRPVNRPAVARACNREAWRMAMARSPWLNCGATITLSEHRLRHSLPLSGTVVQAMSRQCPGRALTGTWEGASGKSAYKLVIQGCLKYSHRMRRPNTSGRQPQDRKNARPRSSRGAARPHTRLELPFDGGLVDHRSNADDLVVLELIKNVLVEGDVFAVDRQIKEDPLGVAIKSESACYIRRLTDDHLHVEVKVGNILEILLEHLPVARQSKRVAVVSDAVGNELAELSPILCIQACDVVLIGLLEVHDQSWAKLPLHSTL